MALKKLYLYERNIKNLRLGRKNSLKVNLHFKYFIYHRENSGEKSKTTQKPIKLRK
jgi:hypothetical protein